MSRENITVKTLGGHNRYNIVVYVLPNTVGFFFGEGIFPSIICDRVSDWKTRSDHRLRWCFFDGSFRLVGVLTMPAFLLISSMDVWRETRKKKRMKNQFLTKSS